METEANGNGKTSEPVQALVMVAHQTALEPNSIQDAITLCKMAVASGMLPSTIKRPEQALMILMRGRELGLTAMQSFACIDVIEGRTSLKAELIVAKVKRSDKCLYFSMVKSDAAAATFETHRRGDPDPVSITYTMEDAKAMKNHEKDNYKKQPANMLRWRCATALARLVYPDLTLGLIDPEEAEIIREDRKVVDAEVVEQAATDDLEERLATFAKRLDEVASKEELKAFVADVGADPAADIIRERLETQFKAANSRVKEVK